MKKITLLLIVLFSIHCLYGQTSKTFVLTLAGTLKDNISVSEQNSLTNITLSGNIDARDFAFLRDKVKLLSVLDMTSATIKAYTGSDGTYTTVSTAYPANEIPDYAFYDPFYFTYKSSLTNIKLPSSVTKIGSWAFYYCWNLAGTVSIPASLTTISEYAFYGCSSIATFTVASSNTRYSAINGVLFNKTQDSLFIFPASKSGTYTIPTTVKHVGASAFSNCYNLTSVLIPNTITSIGSYAFSYCSGITGTLTLPTSLKKLGDGAFYGCWNVSSIVIPATLTDIGYYCFLESNSVTAITVNASNPYYASVNGMLFSKNVDTLFVCPPAKTGTPTIPITTKLIGSHAFYNCSKITGTLIIPQNVDYIGSYAFYNCSLINSYDVNSSNLYFSSENGVLMSKNKDRLITYPITKTGAYQMPATIKTIDPAAFAFCTGLTGNLQIPASVTSIGEYSFYNCLQLSAIDVDAANIKFKSDNGVLYNQAMDTLLVCPLGKTGSYSVPDKVKQIGYSAFDGCSGITSINLPSTLTGIGGYAFEYCTGLSKIQIPKHTTSIANGAFYSCSNLTEISIANPQPPAVDYYTFDLVNKSTCKLIVPTGSTSSYSAANYWNEFSQLTEQVFYDALPLNKTDKIQLLKTGNTLIIKGAVGKEKFELYNLIGRLIISGNFDNNQIGIPALKRGIYILKLGSFRLKIIID